ncbi:TPA: hypothetical protein DEB00_03405 [Candidatus Uhrbacteria bacterium]|nr:hypothetical protein [Candidatus Uhrbacteria bacterium]
MYRYRDYGLERQKAARPWIRWAVVVFSLIFLGYLTVIWVHQGRSIPNATSTVGGPSDLPEDIYAIAVLYNTNNKDLLFEITGVVDSVIAVRTDGSIVAGHEFLNRAPRPPGWFLPTTIGSLYIRQDDTIRTKRIYATKTGLAVSMPKIDTISLPLHPEVILGIHCTNDCLIPGTNGLLPKGSDLLSINDNLVIATNTRASESLLSFIQESSKSRNPIQRERQTIDGRVVTELVSAEEIPTTVIDSALGIVYTGGDRFGWFHRQPNVQPEQKQFIATTSKELLNEYVREISTLSWTSTVCGKHPAVFYKQAFLPMLAENSPNTVTIVRTASSWELCLD